MYILIYHKEEKIFKKPELTDLDRADYELGILEILSVIDDQPRYLDLTGWAVVKDGE